MVGDLGQRNRPAGARPPQRLKGLRRAVTAAMGPVITIYFRKSRTAAQDAAAASGSYAGDPAT